MTTRMLHYVVALLLIGCGLFWVAPAQATITCSTAAMTAVSFSTVNPLSTQGTTSANLTYTCQNSTGGGTHSATLCFSIGEPGGNQTNPRLMKSGSNTLQFQLYQNPGFTTVWGSQYFGSNTPLIVSVTLGGGASTNGTATLNAQVLGGQTTAIPGTYSDNYANGDTALTINDQAGNTAPGSCSGTQSNTVFFPFNVTATVQKNCTVAANDLSLGSVAAGTTPSSGSSTLSVSCSYTTPYNVGLAPLNVANTNGAGTMKGTGTNTNTVTYQLYSNSGLSTVWGNSVTATSTGNGVAGTGSGVAQTLNVYAKVTSTTDVQPDNYSDTVQVNVNY
ncbi:spore coat U domain-containing protein [Rhodanobacter sp. MP7CTX1]|jgi:spore coat protein U-like protein|uniref:Csu type fimbrial protein n=1 Tax=Rhodanobacter sp. MP7CTX1 TaxID=2723084 RepID=UPI0016159EA3|nr:spore coat U domain-containing protein [Rhodanobacter sp. MP7CTX1]MBB6188274.1 spore coat protein U-like protein [Rhodanobacter sp. MP7CTX1]